MLRELLLGARTSPLAVAQATAIADQLRALGHTVHMVGITTQGDTDQRALTEIGGTGVFAHAVRGALLRREVDLVVHSMKDLPTAAAASVGMYTAAIPAREDVSDMLLGVAIDDWTNDTVIGCGSPRRVAQLRTLAAARGCQPTFEPIRGNVDTRIGHVREGRFDATVLAWAGLARLGKVTPPEPAAGAPSVIDPFLIDGVPAHRLGLDQMLPAAGQAALSVECNDDDEAVIAALAVLDDADTRAAVTAERTFLATLEAGCLAPIGVHAVVVGSRLRLDAVVADDDDLLRFGARGRAVEADELGESLARQAAAALAARSAGQS